MLSLSEVQARLFREMAASATGEIKIDFYEAITAPTNVNTIIVGTDGDDNLIGTSEGDEIKGLAGSDHIFGGDGEDYIDGGRDADIMNGGNGFDTYVVDSINDVAIDRGTDFELDQVFAKVDYKLAENSGISFLTAFDLYNPNNTKAINLTGSNSNSNSITEFLEGNNGSNILNGMGGNDVLRGGGGTDFLIGGDGDDSLQGDNLTGGQPNIDSLTGGSGSDHFILDLFLQGGADRITDFSNDEGDEIFFVNVNPGFFDYATEQQFHIGSKAITAEHRVIYNKTTGQLFYDFDGIGEQPQYLMAILENKPQDLRAQNFFLIGE